jgi:drug/metabolite transporter (DMT)-like permease
MNRPIEKIAMALAIAFIIALLVSTLSRLNFSSGMVSGYMICYWIVAIIAVIVRIGCGWWLYLKTKPKQQYPWLWCLLGVVFGLVAIATYYIVEIYKKVSIQEERKET